MEELLELLKGVRPDVDFENETALIDDGILDSFDVVSIIAELDDAFGVQVRITELDPESFNSVERLCYTGKRGMGALEYYPLITSESVDEKINV